MTEMIGVQLNHSGKVYYFSPDGEQLAKGQRVIVETARGIECGIVSIGNAQWSEESIQKDLKPILRVANEEDLATVEESERLAKEALAVCQEKVEAHGLAMRLIHSEYTFDRNKLIFYFTAEDRVDFRELVRDLAQTFRTRIELRQVGVRDQAKMVGGLGACGQEMCCHRYMVNFDPVSIKMAKTQGLSLNPTKISGVCGRLMCCLNFEQEVYLEHNKQAPDIGCLVLTVDGQGYVVDRDVLQRRVRVRVYKEDESQDEKYYTFEELQVIEKRKKGHRRPALRPELMGETYRPEKSGENLPQAPDCASCACPMHTQEEIMAVSEEIPTPPAPQSEHRKGARHGETPDKKDPRRHPTREGKRSEVKRKRRSRKREAGRR
uniref:PSP1 domain-containing protein n=1 Tax=Ndongobacter massiliensis TaxID=1871025 RepID=UPI0009306B56|nr:stage 0 sporulation family protein [Ndongobacter massiliensis]